jgi:antitoxin component of RelBE/YafQ-DinJ toxin-antitoxin module
LGVAQAVYRGYTRRMSATTIKVDSDLRDRINALAAEQGRTAGSVIEMLLEQYIARQKVETARRQMRSASPDVWAAYLAEFHDAQAEASGSQEATIA